MLIMIVYSEITYDLVTSLLMLITDTAHGRLHVTLLEDDIDFLLSPPPLIAVIGFVESAEF